MGKAVLIFLLGSMVMFGVVNLFNNNNIKNALNTSVNYYSDTRTRNIGNSAMQMILSQLADSNSWRVTTAQSLNMLHGTARYTIVDSSTPNPSGLAKVTVYAYCNGSDTNVVKPKTIVSYFHPADIPQYMKYAVLTGGNFSSTFSWSTNIQPVAGYSTSADVQINGNFNLTLASFTETGNLKYNGTYSNFFATTNITNMSQGPDVIFPQTFNTTQIENSANPADIHSGNYALSNTTSPLVLGTKASPKTIVVKGNMSLDNTITYSGYGTILVEGNVSCGVLNRVYLKPDNPATSALGLYVTGNLNSIFDQTEIDANMYILGNVSMVGNNTIDGNLITNKSLSVTWNTNINYIPPIPAITQQYFPVASRPADIRYYLE